MRSRSLFAVSFLVFAVGQSAFALIGPSYLLMKELAATVGANPCVRVAEPAGSVVVVKITVCNDAVGQSLAFILKKGNFEIANEAGTVLQAKAVEPTVDAVAAQIRLALTDNAHFVKMHLNQQPAQAIAEFKPTALQIWMDDISNPYGHRTYLAQTLFAKMLKSQYFQDIHAGTVTSKLVPR